VALANEPNIEASLVVDRSRPTTRKVRFVSEHHSTHLLRADWEVARPIDAEREEAVIAHVLAMLPRASAVVLSDYAKGVLTPRVIRAVIEAAARLDKPVVVDPKGTDFSVYRGATVVTPNSKELAEATRRPAGTDAEVAAAAAELARMVESKAVLVTRSEEGMTLLIVGAPAVHVPAYPVKVRDVSGAGDTVAATLATLLAMGAGFEPAVRAANAAAAVVVGKRGTASVSVAELRSRILPAATLAPEEKIVFDFSVLDDRLTEWRSARKPSVAAGKMYSGVQSARGPSARTVPAPTSTASAKARSRPITNRSASLRPLMIPPEGAVPASRATMPSIELTKLAYTQASGIQRSPS